MNNMIEKQKKKIAPQFVLKVEIATLLVVLIGYILTSVLKITTLTLNDDNYFQLCQGTYILEHGFPITDPIRMHEGFHFLVPQWLYSVYITILYQNFGANGMVYLYALPMMSINAILFITLCSKISKKNANSILIGSLFFLLQLILYSYIRPYLITFCMCLIETLLLEQYVDTKNVKWLIPLPLLSILEINCHNSLWISLFLIQCCYYGEFVVKRIRKEESFKIQPLLICTCVCFVCGLINPYGLEYVTYIFPSMEALKPLKPYIMELRSVFVCQPVLIVFAVLDIIVLLIAIKKKVNVPYRYLFMFVGFGIMFFASIRNGMFFFSFGQLPLIYLVSQIPSLFLDYTKTRILLVGMLLCYIVYALASPTMIHKNSERYNAVDWLIEHDTESIKEEKVLTTFDIGSYAEFKGYKVYIDTCAELYGKAVNHKKDIAQEFVDTFANNKGNQKKIDKFLDKYKFNYCIIDNAGMAYVIEQSGQYELIYAKKDAKYKNVKDNPNIIGGWVFKKK